MMERDLLRQLVDIILLSLHHLVHLKDRDVVRKDGPSELYKRYMLSVDGLQRSRRI